MIATVISLEMTKNLAILCNGYHFYEISNFFYVESSVLAQSREVKSSELGWIITPIPVHVDRWFYFSVFVLGVDGIQLPLVINYDYQW